MGKMGFYLRYPRYLSSPDLTFSSQKGELIRAAGFNGKSWSACRSAAYFSKVFPPFFASGAPSGGF